MKAIYTCLAPSSGFRNGAVVSGFFIVRSKARGHHPPLVNVDATDTDKRDELALCLLGEHPSGQRQVGFDKKVVAPLLNSLDKREHLSPVDNTVDKLPTGTPSGGLSMREIKGLSMDSIQAHKILNEVKEGIWHSQNDIVRALVTTGDIHARCPNLESYSSTGTDDRNSPYLLPSALQTT